MADEEIVTEEQPQETRELSLDESFSPVIEKMGSQAAGVVDVGEGAYKPVEQAAKPDELLTSTQYGLGAGTDVTGTSLQDTAIVSDPERITPTQVENISRNLDNMPTDVQGATVSINANAIVDPAAIVDERTKDELLHEGTLAEAKTQELALQATTKFQLESLYESLEEGKPLPGWASKNIRKVQDIMNARGLGSSSVAAAAMVQAIGESALPIAIEDANKYATIQITNLTNEQQTALANAATIAAIDLKNLDNKMIAAKHNAESFLKMDLLNVTNEQASNIIEYQSNVQALFNDASAENLRLQFNAKTETQVNEFYDQLGATVSKNNLDRETATHQFNVDQENSVTKYMSKLEDSREKFNANMQHLIDQSNAVWRRTISTANNATENEESRLNASALLGMTVQAQNDLWQQYRDEAAFLFQATANDLQRTHQLAMVVIANQFAESMFEAQIDAEDSAQISMFFGDMLKGVFERAMDSVFTGDTESDVADTGGNWEDNLEIIDFEG
jgi:hypothetical protein